MKLNFSWKKQEASLEADVERLVEKGMEINLRDRPRKLVIK